MVEDDNYVFIFNNTEQVAAIRRFKASADPRFIDPSENDYNYRKGSALVKAGFNGYTPGAGYSEDELIMKGIGGKKVPIEDLKFSK